METKFFVAECYRYAESKNWEYKMDGIFDDENLAKQKFHERCAAIMKSSNDFAMAIIYDCFGNKIQSDFIYTGTEPEPETSSIIPE